MIGLLASLIFLTAEHADYDGQNLVLHEAVHLSHPLGEIDAGHAKLHCLKIDPRTPFHRVELSQGVQVQAQTAARRITLTAETAHGQIDAGALYAFQQLECEGHVEIHTSDGLAAQGGVARYSALAGQAGAIDLFPPPLSAHCTLTQGDLALEAAHIRFHLRDSSALASGAPTLRLTRGLLSCQGPLQLNTLERLIKTEAPFTYRDDTIQMHAESGRLTYLDTEGALSPEALYCEGRVHLIAEIQEQESYALAEQLVYFPKSRTLLLSSRAPRRVLFWRADGHVRLSAPQIEVRDETVQGLGDVHCAFDGQEQDLIESFFAKYL